MSDEIEEEDDFGRQVHAGEYFRRHRQKKRLTLTAVAERLGVSQPTVKNLEASPSNVFRYLPRALDAYEVEDADFMLDVLGRRLPERTPPHRSELRIGPSDEFLREQELLHREIGELRAELEATRRTMDEELKQLGDLVRGVAEHVSAVAEDMQVLSGVVHNDIAAAHEANKVFPASLLSKTPILEEGGFVPLRLEDEDS